MSPRALYRTKSHDFVRDKWARQDSNLGPTDYESAALTAELRALPREGTAKIRALRSDSTNPPVLLEYGAALQLIRER